MSAGSGERFGGARRISFLLADTPLFGGTKVALHQANLLARRGHRVTVVTPGEPPDWYRVEADFQRVPELTRRHLPPADVTIATFWTTLEVALSVPGRALHYCQGFEASYTHNHDEHPAILAAYSLPVPAVTVSPHLARLIEERFDRPARVVGQPIEPFFRPGLRLGPRRPPRILVAGPFEIDWKGVRTALEAMKRLRVEGVQCRLERLSQWPLSDLERELQVADAFHCHLDPPAVASLLRDCDLLIAASWEQEGFGLPALEAMACGVPVVASDVSCYRDFAEDGAVLVPAQDPLAFARAAGEVLGSRRRWRHQRRRGRAAAAAFSEKRAADELEAAVEWVLAGAPPLSAAPSSATSAESAQSP